MDEETLISLHVLDRSLRDVERGILPFAPRPDAGHSLPPRGAVLLTFPPKLRGPAATSAKG